MNNTQKFFTFLFVLFGFAGLALWLHSTKPKPEEEFSKKDLGDLIWACRSAKGRIKSEVPFVCEPGGSLITSDEALAEAQRQEKLEIRRWLDMIARDRLEAEARRGNWQQYLPKEKHKPLESERGLGNNP